MGFGIAKVLGREGAVVIINDRNEAMTSRIQERTSEWGTWVFRYRSVVDFVDGPASPQGKRPE